MSSYKVIFISSVTPSKTDLAVSLPLIAVHYYSMHTSHITTLIEDLGFAPTQLNLFLSTHC